VHSTAVPAPLPQDDDEAEDKAEDTRRTV